MKSNIYTTFLILFLIVANFFTGVAGVWVGVTYGDNLGFGSGRNITSDIRSMSDTSEIENTSDLTVEVVEQTRDAVVSVIITKDIPIFEEEFYNPFGSDFFGFGIPQRRQVGEEEQQVGAGSGFIVTADGYIVTNRHVVDDSEAEYTVILNNDERYTAEVIDRDTFLDIAVLKIDATDLPYLQFADSNNVKIGEQVLAIGNTLGEFSNTVSSGIISGLYRSIIAGSQGTGEVEALSDLIQTDASISSGNSGGPLINLNGEVVGVNVAVSVQGENVGFAIPSNQVANIVESVIENGRIIRPFVGVRYRQIDARMQETNNLDYDYGAVLIRGANDNELAVIPGSPADIAGLVENDIILEVDGVKLDGETSLQNEIQKFKVGDEVILRVYSKGEEKDVNIVLDALD